MKIVHVITRLIIGGAQENTLLTCEGLSRRGHDVTLIAGPTTGPEGSLIDRARGGGYRYEEISELVRQVRPMCELRALRALRRRFHELQPDVVHTHSSKAGILGRWAAHQAGVPLIVHTIHGMSFNRTQPWFIRRVYAAAERACAGRCHSIVCVADDMTRQSLAAGVGRPEQYCTIRSGIDVADFDPAKLGRNAARQALGLPTARNGGAIVIGAIARLFPNKGYEQLIDIMQRAVAMQPDLHFLWVGDGSHRGTYEAELSRRRLRERVTITGLLPPTRMPQVLAAMDILAHASQWEGLPRAVVQALLMERPAVSFAIDGAPEVVTSGQTGFTVPLGDHDGFARSLVALARDEGTRQAMGREGRRRCLEEFDHRRMIDEVERLYLERLGG